MNFRDMTPQQRFELASRGGRRAHARGTGRQWTTEEATAAARKSVTLRAARKLAKTMEPFFPGCEITASVEPSLRCPDNMVTGPEAA